MLNPNDIQALLDDLESDRVERTIATKDTIKFSEAICAFANDMPNHRLPGYLIVGADNKTGAVAGIPITDELLINLTAIRSDGNIQPLPALKVEKVPLAAGEVAVVEVQPSDLPPVRFKGRICVRVGPRRGDANEQEERILTERRTRLSATWDVHPVPESGVKDLSLRLFSDYRTGLLPPEVIAANHRTIEEQLAALRFFDIGRGQCTVAGIIVFGTNPRYFLPGAYVQFLRFPGTTMTDEPIDQAEIDGDLATIAEGLHAKVKQNTFVSMSRSDGFRENLEPTYPEWALREFLHNALMHRDYQSSSPVRVSWFADRIEIENPGGLNGYVTAQSLTQRNWYRNPTIAEALKTLGYVNRFGYGIQRAQQLLAAGGHPAPVFDVDDRAFTVKVLGRPV